MAKRKLRAWTKKDMDMACPSRKSYPRVLMMQPGQNGRDGNGPTSLDRSR